MDNFKEIALEEEQRWKEIYTAIEAETKRTRRNADDDFDEAKRLTQELVAARDEDKLLISSDETVAHGLSKLREDALTQCDLLLEQPYFARMVCEEEDKEFQFLLGLASFPKKRIIDWREAPISRLYYEYNQGDDYSEEIAGRHREGTILLRRGYKGKGSELQLIECAEGQIVKKDGDWEFKAFKKDESGKFQRSRTEAASSHLPPILSLITAEQYELITADIEKPLLIEGIAGSGKTTVALHRLAWMLHEKNSPARAGNSCVLVFNQTLKMYIRECLPELGIKNLKVHTFADWVCHRLGLNVKKLKLRQINKKHLEVIKTTPALMDSVTLYLSKQRQDIARWLQKKHPDISKNKAFKSFTESTKSGDCFIQDFAELRAHLVGAAQDATSLKANLDQLKQRIQDPVKDLQKFWEYLVIESDPSIVWPQFAEQQLDSYLDEIQAALAQNTFDNHDFALMLYLAQKKLGSDYRDSFVNLKGYDHIMVDEVQDLDPIAVQGILASVENKKQLTLVGDFGQQIYEEGRFKSFQDLIKYVKLDPDDLTSLRLSFRSTRQVLELAQYVRQKTEIDEEEAKGVFVGPEPEFVKVETESDYYAVVKDWIAEIKNRYADTHSAIICRSAREAKELFEKLQELYISGIRLGDHNFFNFDPGITITHVHQVKGLEFRHVLIANPSNENYRDQSALDRNLLYVAITRAEERLDFIVQDEATSLLPADSWDMKVKKKGQGPDLEWFQGWANADDNDETS